MQNRQAWREGQKALGRRRRTFFENGETVYSVYSKLGGLVFRYNATDTTKHDDYIRAGGINIARLTGSGASYAETYLLTDQQGSAIAAADASGAVLWRESYRPYGRTRLDPPANDNNTGYTGHLVDKASGLVYMQARYYDAAIGRFYSTDPIGYEDQLNLYAYVANDPVNKVDPNGEQSENIMDQRNAALASFARDNPKVALTAAAVLGGGAIAAAFAPEIGAAVLANAPALTQGTAAVGGLVPGTEGTVLAGAAVATANAAADAAGATRGAAAGLVTRAGETFSGLSTRAGGPGQATNAAVQGALDAVPAGERSVFHGACCEINAMSNALNAGADIRGGTMAAVNAGGPNAGALKPPCSSCEAVMRQLEVEPLK